MTEMQALMRESFELALARDDEFPRLFYDILFHRHPVIEQLFGETGRGQHSLDAMRKMFGQTLVALVDRIDDEAWLEATLVPMGAAHRGYGVEAAMYPHVGDALVEALAETCAEEWTAAHEAAWRRAYDHIAAIMMGGAR